MWIGAFRCLCNLKIKIKLISKAFLMQKESKEWLMAVIVVFNW
ncbi:hypothetical protein HMPREF3226_00568 [Prevotella corporis]|uniref:Uncharacterized protein n=1 Tax=Prevotella corporis TaxID=28128 RepID=A0A133QJP8_9BACT|nr:hypothetical protein HMPREF3226_00568 [Prevotella corporis]